MKRKKTMNYNDLQVGDIILVRDQKDFISKAIRFITDSEFEHSEIIVGHLKYKDDDRITITSNAETGVCISNLSRYDNRKINYEVWRYRGGLTPDQKGIIVETLFKYLHQKYDFFGAGSFVLPFMKHSKNRQFCSELVARAYNEIGFNFGKPFDKVTPGDIKKCGVFDRVF
jgi:hypothetical protein